MPRSRQPKARVARRRPSSSSSRPAVSRLGFLTVGQTARIIGISPSTLRLWENVGLVSPARSDGRYRLYSPELIQVLKRIKYLRDVKQLNVPGIKQALGSSLPAAGEAPKQTTRVAELGPTLRKLRTRVGLSLSQAAAKAGVSTGFLSSIERSRANASVATLQRLAATYGTTVLDLFDLPRRPSHVVRQHERRALQAENGVRIELLSNGAAMLEPMIFVVPPGAGSDGAYSHQGEEFIYMLRGTLEIWLDELDCHVLTPGDSLWFDSSQGHRWYNPSDAEAVLIWVNTPPTF